MRFQESRKYREGTTHPQYLLRLRQGYVGKLRWKSGKQVNGIPHRTGYREVHRKNQGYPMSYPKAEMANSGKR